MKVVFWLLLLVNIVLLGYFQLHDIQPTGAGQGNAAIHPEQLHILSAQELASMPKKTGSVPLPVPEPVSCYEWGSFSGDSLVRAQRALEGYAVQFSMRQTAPREAARYWVYIPPARSQEQAQAKSDELRVLGVQDIFLVQEPKWRNAISLGVFKDEALANRLLQELRAKGVKSAVKGVRNHEGSQSRFLLGNVSGAVADEITKLQPDFPGSELRKVSCQ